MRGRSPWKNLDRPVGCIAVFGWYLRVVLEQNRTALVHSCLCLDVGQEVRWFSSDALVCLGVVFGEGRSERAHLHVKNGVSVTLTLHRWHLRKMEKI